MGNEQNFFQFHATVTLKSVMEALGVTLSLRFLLSCFYALRSLKVSLVHRLLIVRVMLEMWSDRKVGE